MQEWVSGGRMKGGVNKYIAMLTLHTFARLLLLFRKKKTVEIVTQQSSQENHSSQAFIATWFDLLPAGINLANLQIIIHNVLQCFITLSHWWSGQLFFCN